MYRSLALLSLWGPLPCPPARWPWSHHLQSLSLCSHSWAVLTTLGLHYVPLKMRLIIRSVPGLRVICALTQCGFCGLFLIVCPSSSSFTPTRLEMPFLGSPVLNLSALGFCAWGSDWAGKCRAQSPASATASRPNRLCLLGSLNVGAIR